MLVGFSGVSLAAAGAETCAPNLADKAGQKQRSQSTSKPFFTPQPATVAPTQIATDMGSRKRSPPGFASKGISPLVKTSAGTPNLITSALASGSSSRPRQVLSIFDW